MLKNRVIYIAVLFLLLLFRIAYTGYVAGMLLVMVLVLPVFSWLISLPGALFTSIFLSAPDQVTRGCDAVIRISLRRSPLFATGPVRGKLKLVNLTDGSVTLAKLTDLMAGVPVDTSHCGAYTCSISGIRILDLMGLLPLPARKASPIQVSIMPIPSEPPEHPDWSAGAVQIAKPFSGGGNPYDLRDYRTGDTLRSIHWKKSASLDKTVVMDTLEPAVRIASIWIDWPQDASGRDLALDQLAWCIIYLKQNNAGLRLNWMNDQNRQESLYVSQGDLDRMIPAFLVRKPGYRCSQTFLQPYEILLSAGNEGGAEAS